MALGVLGNRRMAETSRRILVYAQSLRINFQPANAPAATGTRPDRVRAATRTIRIPETCSIQARVSPHLESRRLGVREHSGMVSPVTSTPWAVSPILLGTTNLTEE